MPNEHLKTALTQAGLTVEEFADIIGVDAKTAERWISGRTPTHATAPPSAAHSTAQNTNSGPTRPAPQQPLRTTSNRPPRRRVRSPAAGAMTTTPAHPTPSHSSQTTSKKSTSSTPPVP